jgi:putative endonuclease
MAAFRILDGRPSGELEGGVGEFAYTYVLRCADGDWYIGSTPDLRRRVQEHREGKVHNTRKRLPAELVYYEACRSLAGARARERQLKTGFGRGYQGRGTGR